MPTGPSLKILLVEDDADDVFLLQDFLSRQKTHFIVDVAGDLAQFVKRLNSNPPDIILADHRLSNFTSREVVRVRNTVDPSIPVILVSGSVSEELAIAVVEEGISDYVFKDKLQRLPLSVKIALDRRRLAREKNLAEQALGRINERYRLATEASIDIIFEYDFRNRSLYCSHALTTLLGYPSGSDTSIETVKAAIHPADLPLIVKSIEDFIGAPGKRWVSSFRMYARGGKLVHMKTSAMMLKEDGTIARMVGVMQDVSVVVNLQRELLEKELQRQRQIAEEVVKAQEKERKEIGQELHDNVNQLLASAKMMIDMALSQPGHLDEPLAKAKETLAIAINEVRQISHNMMPPGYQEENFIQAMERITEPLLYSQAHLTLSLPPVAQLESISFESQLAIFRITQEQVANIQKHAGATAVWLDLRKENGTVRLSVRDNGRGFNKQERKPGIGLANIANRVEMLEGTMDLQTAPGEGTELVVQLPL